MKKKKTPTSNKMYVCRSHIMAKNLSEARRIFMKAEPDEIWISEEWKEGKNNNFASAIGFDKGMDNDIDN